MHAMILLIELLLNIGDLSLNIFHITDNTLDMSIDVTGIALSLVFMNNLSNKRLYKKLEND